MIKIKKLNKSFANHVIFKDLDLRVEKSKILALVGFSGSGKSTLLKLISGLEKADSGLIELESQRIGMCFQYSALFDSMTVSENISFPLRVGCEAEKLRYGPEKIQRLVKEKLDLVGLSGTEALYPNELSGGMKKRVSLARAIINDPQIILYDEPTAGLDPVASTIIEDLIVKLQNETQAASIVVTHQRSTIERTATEVAMLYEGKIVWQGSSYELFDPENQDNFAKQFREGAIQGPMLVRA
jgi:phospholipid/cholesterol/gamma-HCH transport system ATP-binding protein